MKNMFQTSWSNGGGGSKNGDIFDVASEDVFLFDDEVSDRKAYTCDASCDFFFVVEGID